MKIIRMSWLNFRGLVDDELVADGHDVIVSGQNGTGKSSIAQIVPFVLFGKDAAKIKRYENGIVNHDDGLIHGAEIEFDDGTTLRREYFWTPQGNRNNLFVNGEAVKQTAFKVHVDKMTNGGGELVFNPFAFCELPSKDQRALLTKFFSATTEREILTLPEFSEVAKIFDGMTAECFISFVKQELKNPTTEAANIPVQIEELQRQLPDGTEDVTKLEAELENLKTERSNIPDGFSDDVQKLSDDISVLREERAKIWANQSNNFTDELSTAQKRVSDLEFNKNHLARQIEAARVRKQELLDEYHRVKQAKPGKCPTCGQAIPIDQFETKREKELSAIVVKGNNAKAEISELETIFDDICAKILDANEQIAALTSKAQEQSAADNLRADRLAELDKTIRDYTEKLKTLQADEETARRNRRNELDGKIFELTQQLTQTKAADEIRARIENLRVREKELNKKIAELENHLALAEKFLQTKIQLVEEKINANFEHIKFKLFDYLITTGEVRPTCEATLNGVPYSALSKGERLKAVLDIFRALQKHFGAEMPLIIDDAESYTLNSWIDLPNQIFLFRVTDESKLSITIEKARRAA